ncbi:FkbM family methyltransferase [Sulfolobus sp. S-194]|uniref:FkbM family methyltransferase n=1 Tax=Sulfolobus sp. S-194 TaxID=2512240 RepID=UPI0014373D1A|nr:FkbM family methyltransferase [Sulfolobus sp. S-194]QIW24511.1 FkbM family methyltransferase [Sulfolobus sp. S-194]
MSAIIVDKIKGYMITLNNYRKVYSNYYSVILKRVLKNNKIKVRIRNGPKSFLGSNEVAKFAAIFANLYPNIKIISIDNNKITFEYLGKRVTLIDWVYGGSDAFIDYNWLNVYGKTVIDVGANIGDSAIWFALNGAKKVVAIEPYLFPYRIMLKNIDANNLSDKIFALNCGIGKDNIKIKVTKEITFRGSSLKSATEGIEIPVYTLDYVIEKYGPFDILKMDCEGCEYDAILNSKNLGIFRQIQIEYHYGCEKLKTKLESLEFNVKCTIPVKVYNPYADSPNMLVGYLYAYK